MDNIHKKNNNLNNNELNQENKDNNVECYITKLEDNISSNKENEKNNENIELKKLYLSQLYPNLFKVHPF